MNKQRIILGGLLAGLVWNSFEFLVHIAFSLAKGATKPYLSFASPGQIALVWLQGFAIGLAVAWLYAAIRPRLGAGPKTAAIASLFIWFTQVLAIVAGLATFLSTEMMLWGVFLALVGMLIAGQVAGYVYQEAVT